MVNFAEGMANNSTETSNHEENVSEILTDAIIWAVIGVVTVITNFSIFVCTVTSNINQNLFFTVLNSSFLIGILFGGFYILPQWAAEYFTSEIPGLCFLLPSLGSLLLLCYNLHQCFISIDRYYAVKWPICYRKKIHKSCYIYFITAIWLFSLLFVSIPFMTYRIVEVENCTNLSDEAAENVFLFITFIATNILPVIIIIFCYANIYHKFYRQRSKTFALTTSANQQSKRSVDNKTIKASIQMGFLVIIFMVLMLPSTFIFTFGSLGLMSSLPGIVAYHLHIVSRYVSFLYPAVNPLLYCYFVDSIRSAVKSKILTKLCFHNENSVSVYQERNNSGTVLVNYTSNS
ncbi:Trace amine-associated receptor 8b [Trichoplax sp. H2]|nr:Trace amine-associated receptor 8b [Trichoplax sp. H2]|eukprot:RDD38811.1 Trace amine-associated receptor 8b [Trichoplax sp. H2]